MRDISTIEYKSYTVTVVVVPQADGAFISTFALDKDGERVHILTRSTIAIADRVFASPLSTAPRFGTLADARAASLARAHAWVDAATADGYEIRAVNDTTTGDFLSFEMFVGNRWREVRISTTALAVLDRGASNVRLDIFEQHLAAILRAAAPKALAAPDTPFVPLDAPL